MIGFGKRLSYATRCFFSVLSRGEVPADIAPYQDAQVGAAVRELHANCRKALAQYVTLEPIMEGEEDGPVTVEEGFDPSSVKLVGNVTGRPPLRGLLRHRGWRVAGINMPSLPPRGAVRAVVAPAEVEIQ